MIREDKYYLAVECEVKIGKYDLIMILLGIFEADYAGRTGKCSPENT